VSTDEGSGATGTLATSKRQREADVTEIREPSYSVDLPGSWGGAEEPEPGVSVYRETDGTGILTVTLLGVKPMFAIADPKRLLDDYLQHRSRFEQARDPAMEFSATESSPMNESVEGGWEGFAAEENRRVRHRVMLADNLLAHFRYEAAGLDESNFDQRAEMILGSASVTVEG
jgi:hypothetical protein